ncbi:MAG: hypothetical protein HOP21_02985 [Methylotenera sp.]|nr:hypothetical protein [Methylotenera sp.]
MNEIKDKYKCPKELLPEGFNYPKRYIDYIKLDNEEFDLNGFSSSIAFLWDKEIKSFLEEAKQASWLKKLIPFGSLEDELFCFAGDGSEKIYVIDLGDSPLKAHVLPYQNFYEFINVIRVANGLEPWNPL